MPRMTVMDAVIKSVQQTIRDLDRGNEPGIEDDPACYAFRRFLEHLEARNVIEGNVRGN